MVLATGIENLQKVVERVRSEGQKAVADLVREMKALEQDASHTSLDELARLCRVGAETLQQLGLDDQSYAPHAEMVIEHLSRLVDFACACAVQSGKGGGAVEIVPPPLLTIPDPEEEKHFLETVGMFVSHAIGSVAELEEDILAVESSQDQVETIGGIRRVVHTMKAEFGVLNMGGPQQLCHQAETTIDACTESQRGFPVDVMLECADVLKQFLDRLTRDARAEFPDVTMLLEKLRKIAADTGGATTAGPTGDEPRVQLEVGGEFADSLPEFVTEARSHLVEAEAAMLALEGNKNDLEHINLTFRAFHTIKGVAGFLNLTPLVELAHVSETLLDQARSQRMNFCQDDVDLILASGDLINQMINSIEGQPAPLQSQLKTLVGKLQKASSREESAATNVAVEEPAPCEAMVQAECDAVVPEPKSGATEPTVVERPVANKAVAEKPVDKQVLKPQPRPSTASGKEAPASEDATEHKAAKIERTVKVSTTRLDMLVDMVGELVIAQSMVLQDQAIQRLDSQSLARNISQVGKITRDLQEAAMSLRMVTVKPTFQKMARLVRDVASKSGKKVALTIQGEDTELDRNVVEQISDPLVHMIRNAIDHGIEVPDNRRLAGKNLEGQLLLRAYHQGGSIVIEIQDDGRGIDKNRVVQKAVEKGLLPAETKPQDMSDAEAFGIIFLPGFSTAEKVTDLSGRGVGMDVVRRNIEALRGKIEIESRLGEGTTFRMRLPLTLAIIDGMVVRVGRERYVVPTLSIEQSFRPGNDDVHYLIDRGECVRVRGTVLPIYRLKQIFEQSSGFDDMTEGILIVVEVDGDRSCLFVDEILGQQQVVIKSLGMQGDRVCGVSGGAIMSDGRIALILDVGSLVNSAVGVS
ncbi:MAG: chemotaxis protein CheA [Planctomycetes bacterium]|nr:chemotaxis protein CheA [Planctomycetota bacterium]